MTDLVTALHFPVLCSAVVFFFIFPPCKLHAVAAICYLCSQAPRAI